MFPAIPTPPPPEPVHALEAPPTHVADNGQPFHGTIAWHGLNLDIENARYSVRRGQSPQGAWATALADHYGEVRGSLGNDGDAIDVFVGRDPTSTTVYVVAIAHPDGTFDEVKAMVDYASLEEALSSFVRSYDKVPTVLRITPWPVEAFVERIRSSLGPIADDWRADGSRVLVKAMVTLR